MLVSLEPNYPIQQSNAVHAAVGLLLLLDRSSAQLPCFLLFCLLGQLSSLRPHYHSAAAAVCLVRLPAQRGCSRPPPSPPPGRFYIASRLDLGHPFFTSVYCLGLWPWPLPLPRAPVAPTLRPCHVRPWAAFVLRTSESQLPCAAHAQVRPPRVFNPSTHGLCFDLPPLSFCGRRMRAPSAPQVLPPCGRAGVVAPSVNMHASVPWARRRDARAVQRHCRAAGPGRCAAGPASPSYASCLRWPRGSPQPTVRCCGLPRLCCARDAACTGEESAI
jgi:hypothetical protein